MTTKTYTDFDLLIERTGRKYRARVLNSPAGPAVQEFTLPFSDEKLENFILRLSQGRRVTRAVKPVEVDASREFGELLFKAVFAGAVDDCWRNSLAAIDPNQQSLRLRLRLSDAPELVDIPWEYLYDANNRRFLALSVDTPLVRYLDIAGRITPLAVKPPLNVLVMISSPTDVVELDVEQEWQRLQNAVEDLQQEGRINLVRLKQATLEELQLQLRRNDYHVFHYIGHGGFDPRSNDGILMLEDENGRGKEVSGLTLGTLLHDEKTLRLALLNACEGGRTSKTDPFAGVGQSLLQQGVPAVIAMQFEVTDDTAIVLAHSFYAALADGYPVDAALTEARKTIFARNPLEWGTPVLYMRSPDGRIFDVASLDSATKIQNQIAALLTAAQNALHAQEWNKAEEFFKQVLTLDAANSAAAIGLASARQGMTSIPKPAPPQPHPSQPAAPRFGSGMLLTLGGGLIAILLIWLIFNNLGGWNATESPTMPATPNPVELAAANETAVALQTAAEVARDETRTAEIRATLQAEQTQTAEPMITADAATRQVLQAQLTSAAATATQAWIEGKTIEINNARATNQALQATATSIAATAIAAEQSRQEAAQRPTDTPVPAGVNSSSNPNSPQSEDAKTSPDSKSQPGLTTYIDCPTDALLRAASGSVHNRLYIGGTAIVLGGAKADAAAGIYASETYESGSIGKIPVGREVLILDGPRCVKGNSNHYYQRWLVRDLQTNLEGWTSEGGMDVDDKTHYWLEPKNLYQACPGYPSRIKVGDSVYMAWNATLSLRRSPTRAESAVTTRTRLQSKTLVKVVGGPECADNWTFWLLEVNGSKYYAGEGDPNAPDKGYWLVPTIGGQVEASTAAASESNSDLQTQFDGKSAGLISLSTNAEVAKAKTTKAAIFVRRRTDIGYAMDEGTVHGELLSTLYGDKSIFLVLVAGCSWTIDDSSGAAAYVVGGAYQGPIDNIVWPVKSVTVSCGK